MGESSDKAKQPYEPPAIVEEEVFEREALTVCGTKGVGGGPSCDLPEFGINPNS